MVGTLPGLAPEITSGCDIAVGRLEGARRRGPNSLRAMQHAQDIDIDIDAIRPWRRATIAVSAVAAVELVALAAVAIVLLGNPIAKHLRETTAAAAGPPRVRTAQPAPAKKPTQNQTPISCRLMVEGILDSPLETTAPDDAHRLRPGRVLSLKASCHRTSRAAKQAQQGRANKVRRARQRIMSPAEFHDAVEGWFPRDPR